MKIIKLVEEKGACSLPWLHAELSLQHNSVKPCCKYTDSWGRVTDGMAEVWGGSKAVDMRRSMKDGLLGQHCGACSGGDQSFTYKNWKNDLYANKLGILTDQDTEQWELPRVYHFSLSNTCNLACRMCNPQQSSKLADITRKNVDLQKFLKLHPHQKKINIEALRGSFTNTQMITFAGGEPTIDDDCLEVIKMIRDESVNLKLVNFSTNMMSVNHEMMKILNSMDAHVNLSFSIDGPPHIHEYIRYTGRWNTMVENIATIKNTYPRITWAVNSTVSILNAGYVTEILDTVGELGRELGIEWRSFMTSPVIDKWFLHPGLLPSHIKSGYLEKIRSYRGQPSIKWVEQFLPTAEKMLEEVPAGGIDTFVGYIQEFDRIAKTNVVDYYPEFSELFRD